jgi:hypothetical protein
MLALGTLSHEFEDRPSGLGSHLYDRSGGVYNSTVGRLFLVFGVQSPLSLYFFRRYFLLTRKNDIVWGIQNQHQIRFRYQQAQDPGRPQWATIAIPLRVYPYIVKIAVEYN